MREGWREVSLAEVAAINPRETLNRGVDAPFIEMAAVAADFGGVKEVSSRPFTGGGSRFRSGDVIFARITPCLENGKVARVPLLPNAHVGHGSTEFIVLRGIEGVSDTRYLHYRALTPELMAYVIPRMTGTSGRQRLPAESLGSFTFRLPPLDEQRRIAAVLGGLDDLIGINQRLTAQLNDAASVTAVRALRLAPSRISIGDVAAHLPGKYLSKDQYVPAGPFVVYGSNSIMGNYSEALYDGPLTVLARIGSNCGALRLSPGGAWINNNASAIKANSGQPAFWIHAALEQIDMDTHRGGSGQPFIRIESLMKESIPWGDQALLESTNKLLGELANATATLSEEIRALATTRDELLPLLMSGAVAPGEVTVAS